MLACDNCTTRKSAPLQVGANLEPLYDPLQVVIRFLRVLIPAPPTASLAGCLPRFDALKLQAENQAYHVPNLADTTRMRCACPFSVCLSPGSAHDDVLPLRQGTTGYLPFG